MFKSNASRMYDDVKKLSDMGGRSAGSQGDNNAKNFMKSKFEEANFEVIEEEFEVDAFEEYKSYLKVDDEKYETKAMYFSESTSDNGLEGELIYCGTGKKEDVENKDLNGKIVIFKRDKNEMKDQFWPEVAMFASKGAAGAILINYDPWIFITTLETGYFEASKRFKDMIPKNIPAIVINNESGNKILEKMKNNKVNANIYIDAFNGKRKAVNLRAIKKGVNKPKEKILVYGHRDSVGTPGANDNGSGSIIMLELARLLKDVELDRTLEILSTSAEEQLGSMGAYNYIEKHKEELHNIKAGIEMDMVGAGSPLKVMQGGNWPDIKIEYPKWICEYVKNVADELQYHVDIDYCVLGTPDSGRFTEAGVPTTWIWGDGDVYYHSPEDTIDKVDPNKLKAAADIVINSVYKLSQDDNI